MALYTNSPRVCGDSMDRVCVRTERLRRLRLNLKMAMIFPSPMMLRRSERIHKSLAACLHRTEREARSCLLVIFHTCGGIKTEYSRLDGVALKAGYVVLVPDAMRGLRSDCGSPPQIPNARLIKDALDGGPSGDFSHTVDSKRISILDSRKARLSPRGSQAQGWRMPCGQHAVDCIYGLRVWILRFGPHAEQTAGGDDSSAHGSPTLMPLEATTKHPSFML